MTAVGGTTLNAEANLEFDGSTLTVGGGGAFTGNIDLNSDTNKLKLGPAMISNSGIMDLVIIFGLTNENINSIFWY